MYFMQFGRGGLAKSAGWKASRKSKRRCRVASVCAGVIQSGDAGANAVARERSYPSES